MVVCSCRAVSDRTVRAAIASGAGSVDDLSAMCSVADRCGGCWPTLERLISEHAERAQGCPAHAAA